MRTVCVYAVRRRIPAYQVAPPTPPDLTGGQSPCADSAIMLQYDMQAPSYYSPPPPYRGEGMYRGGCLA